MTIKYEGPDCYKREHKALVNVLKEFFGDSGQLNWEHVGASICGGAITSIFTKSKVNDLDFYFRDLKYLETVINQLMFEGWEMTLRSDNCFNLKHKETSKKIQLITRFTGTPEQIFDSFDYTICKGAYCFVDKQFYLHPRFLPDIAKKELVYDWSSHSASQYPICALYRSLKYQRRGFKMPGKSIILLALHIHRLEIETYQELREHLMGIDTLFLIGFLKRNKEHFNPDCAVDWADFSERLIEDMEDW